MDLTSSAISVMRDDMVLLVKGMLLRTYSGLKTLATLYSSMIAGLMMSSAIVGYRPCLAIKSAMLFDAVSREALLRSMRNTFNVEDEEQTLSLRATWYAFGLLANEG